MQPARAPAARHWLRSSARLLYLSTFAASAALGARGRGSLAAGSACAPLGIVGACLALHAFDPAASLGISFLPCRSGGFRPAPRPLPRPRTRRRAAGARSGLDLLSPAATKTWAASNPFSSRATTAPCSPHGRPCPQRATHRRLSLPSRLQPPARVSWCIPARDDLPAPPSLTAPTSTVFPRGSRRVSPRPHGALLPPSSDEIALQTTAPTTRVHLIEAFDPGWTAMWMAAAPRRRFRRHRPCRPVPPAVIPSPALRTPAAPPVCCSPAQTGLLLLICTARASFRQHQAQSTASLSFQRAGRRPVPSCASVDAVDDLPVLSRRLNALFTAACCLGYRLQSRNNCLHPFRPHPRRSAAGATYAVHHRDVQNRTGQTSLVANELHCVVVPGNSLCGPREHSR